ncbi:MAG TPA: O-antigen ligase family protein [Candidatus Saccharimonadales bacterium]|nr:O-antigen ligase family protein [Candidatus Saccharimonadales bacterium]
MNRFAPVNLTRALSWLAALIIALVPFHAFLTVWLASLVGHYTLLRLWKEFILVLIVLGCLYLLVRDRALAKKFLAFRLVRLIAAYLALLLICGLVALAAGNVTAKAMCYGLLVDSRFLIFFLAVWILVSQDGWLAASWQKLLLAPSILVATFAVLQYLVLPYDYLKHFGYSQSTIFPYETINHNLNRLRVMSTLRGANPLGAYLIVPLSALAVGVFKEKGQRRDKLMFAAGLLLALIFSFSRSAWLGVGLSIFIIIWLLFRSFRVRKEMGWVLAGILIVMAALTFGLRNNLTFENAIFHTDRVSTAKESSNQGHETAFKLAIKDIEHHPLGSGVGTAGPQSVYNNHPAKIAENYFLQIGQEAGIIGLVLFIAICAALGQMLYERRADPLALALFASLIGLSLVNLLSHAWSDDTLAYVWWGLAGIALAPILAGSSKPKNAKKIKQT